MVMLSYRIPSCDDRGEEIIDWLYENDLSVLNDGDATRFDKKSGISVLQIFLYVDRISPTNVLGE